MNKVSIFSFLILLLSVISLNAQNNAYNSGSKQANVNYFLNDFLGELYVLTGSINIKRANSQQFKQALNNSSHSSSSKNSIRNYLQPIMNENLFRSYLVTDLREEKSNNLVDVFVIVTPKDLYSTYGNSELIVVGTQAGKKDDDKGGDEDDGMCSGKKCFKVNDNNIKCVTYSKNGDDCTNDCSGCGGGGGGSFDINFYETMWY